MFIGIDSDWVRSWRVPESTSPAEHEDIITSEFSLARDSQDYCFQSTYAIQRPYQIIPVSVVAEVMAKYKQ